METTQQSHQELWYNADNDRYYLLKDGEKIQCDSMGSPCQRFVPYCTGHFGYQDRMQYSNTTNTSYLLAKQPHSLSDLNSCYRPMQDKFNGYSQFPRPLSNIVDHNFTLDTKKTQTRHKRKTKLFSPMNTSAFQFRDPRLTCSFLSARASSTITVSNKLAATTVLSARALPHMRDSGLKTMTGFAPTGLPKRELLLGSTLKSNYANSLKQTFRPMHSMAAVGEETSKLLGKYADPPQVEPTNSGARSYRDIREMLGKEAKEIGGYQAPVEKETRVAIKGFYTLHTPTEGELQARAHERRKLVNPGAFEEEAKRDQLDHRLLAKRRQQKLLKNMAMETVIRAKERALMKEKQNTLINGVDLGKLAEDNKR